MIIIGEIKALITALIIIYLAGHCSFLTIPRNKIRICISNVNGLVHLCLLHLFYLEIQKRV